VLGQKANECWAWDVSFELDVLEGCHVELAEQGRPMGGVQRYHVDRQGLDRRMPEDTHCGLH